MNGTSISKGLLLAGAALLASALVSCRGGISEKPPLHPVLDMDFQQKVKAQMASDFDGFTDGRGMRQPPEGTVARLDVPVASSTGRSYRTLDELARLETYRSGEDYVTENPVAATRDNVMRGQEQYNIHCAVCHDRSGSGQGLALQRAKAVAPGAFNYMVPDLGKEPRLREQADGYLFHVISTGAGLTMPGYAHQIPVEDRWRIVHYLRVLQARFN